MTSSNDDLIQIRDSLRQSFAAGVNKTLDFRLKHLKAISDAIYLHYDEACEALAGDLGRSRAEAAGELEAVLADLKSQVKGLKSGWMDPEPRTTHMLMTPGHTEVRREAFGVVLVVAPFNYPLNLGLTPVIGAIAAGNTVVLKPSEMTPLCEKWFVERLGKALPKACVSVVQGGIPRTTALLALQWDFIFFTGSPAVGKIVSLAAAKHLTPTVMELGGKAPVVVTESVMSIDEAAKRIVLGKFINAGQTCMAPDYVLVHHSQHKALLASLTKFVKQFYGSSPRQSADYGRICTEAHAARAVKLIETSGGEVLCGHGCKDLGNDQADVSARFVPPTVVDQPDLASDLMTQEIFGPILPVLPYGQEDKHANGSDGNSLATVLKLINSIDDQPLALSVFATDKAVTEALLEGVQSGDAMVNETFMHVINPTIPFGGVGRSGHGTYRGRLSFEAFTYQRGVLWRHGVLDIDQTLPFNVRYPPSGKVRNMLLPHAVGLFPCIPRIFVWPSPKTLLQLFVAAVAVYVVLGSESAGVGPLTFVSEKLTEALKYRGYL
eukprot:CAMPEP_0171919598 /NCGR_PEP_ID=MMETSP0993-20121228/18298_1 /TAXON_ID=483369 /ORGANISM="non described non described, Strain CCMP2098" /LENGTH=549 /DNA_ID=CAMNT_0012556307 /DNA_START=8 /DNA_END=1657 /DNA_ORIENTATION=-